MNNNLEKTENAVVSTGYSHLENVNVTAFINEYHDGKIKFERMKMTGSNGKTFEKTSGDSSKPVQVESVEGVIINHNKYQSYYPDRFTGAKRHPECFTYDGIDGYGNPGGKCESCRYNQFDDKTNTAPPCKPRRNLHILEEDEILPKLFSLPTGSIEEFKKYTAWLFSRKRMFPDQVVTRFSIADGTSRSGIGYSKVEFTLVRVLTPEEYALIKPISDQIRQYCNEKIGEHIISIISNGGNVDYDYEIDLDTGEVVEPLN